MTTAGKLMQKMSQYPGLLFVNSDLFNHTPKLQIDILRDQAKTLRRLRNAHSQSCCTTPTRRTTSI